MHVRPTLRRMSAVVLLLSACGSADDTTLAPTTTAAPGPVTLSIRLDATEVPAGTPITGALVFENTGDPVDVLHGGCAPIWGVGLSREELPAQVAFTEPCLPDPVHIPTGHSEIPIAVATTYSSCALDEGAEVPCPEDGGLPPLPPGEYQAVLVINGPDDRQLGGPPPEPVDVTLT